MGVDSKQEARGFMSEQAPEQKRELKNFIINKPLQGRLTFYFTALSLALLGLLIALMNSKVTDIRIVLANASGLHMADQLQVEGLLTQLISTTLIFLLVSIAVTVIFSFVITHRIAGPMKVIVDTIDGMRAGKYEVRRTLRPYDELAPIMDSLKNLAEDLRKKHP